MINIINVLKSAYKNKKLFTLKMIAYKYIKIVISNSQYLNSLYTYIILRLYNDSYIFLYIYSLYTLNTISMYTYLFDIRYFDKQP